MLFKDAIGNEINEGDIVSLAIGSELGMGTVVKTSTGLGLDGSNQSQPAIFIQVIIPRQSFPNGVIPNVLRVVSPDQPKLVEG